MITRLMLLFIVNTFSDVYLETFLEYIVYCTSCLFHISFFSNRNDFRSHFTCKCAQIAGKIIGKIWNETSLWRYDLLSVEMCEDKIQGHLLLESKNGILATE